MKKICVVTGSRAEYGLLKPLIEAILNEKKWKLQLVVTGMHLSPEFGLTYNKVKQDFRIDKKVEMLLSSDTTEGVVKSMGIGLIGFADALKELHPDLIVILGDRFEILAVSQTALIYKIPVAHINGGEITEGAYDDSIRNAITKMSHLHFASTEIYRARIIQMGENPKHVFNVGALSIDNIKNLHLLSKSEVEKRLQIKFKKYNYLVTYHPVTLNDVNTLQEFKQLIAVIDIQEDSFFIFTKSNADNGGREINNLIDEYVLTHPHKSCVFASLGELMYLSTMQYMSGVVGNSSSGIVEAPALLIPTINIGDRQKGRIQSKSIINCTTDKEAIENAFKKIKSDSFRHILKKNKNPYGSGNTAINIVKKLKAIDWNDLIPKKFYDINFHK